MSQWEDRKDELIQKLEKSKMTFRDILAQDKDYLVFTPQDREELESLLQRNDKVSSPSLSWGLKKREKVRLAMLF